MCRMICAIGLGMRCRLLFRAAVAALVITATVPARADVRLPQLFGAGMVLQRSMPIPVWGWATPAETVTVRLGDVTRKAKADGAGRWRVNLPARTEATGLTLSVRGANEITLADVAVGEVWVCSGQSNMQWPLRDALNGAEEVANADHPGSRHVVRQEGNIRFYEIAIPRERIADLKLETGSTFEFVFVVGNDQGPTAAFGAVQAVTKENGLTMKPYWQASPSCDVQWALVE